MIKPSDMDIIFAKRKYPELNKKENLFDTLLKYKNQPDVYVSFADINKLGINPKTKWTNKCSVNGIWAYPIDFLISQIVDDMNIGVKIDENEGLNLFPVYGSDMKYIFIIKDKHIGRNLNDTYTDEELDNDIEKLKTYFNDIELTTEDERNIYESFESCDDSIESLYTVISYLLLKRKENKNIFPSQINKILTNVLNINSISWVDNQNSCDIEEETIFLNNKSFEIIDVIKDFNEQKFKKLFIQYDDFEGFDDSYWKEFLEYLEENGQEEYDYDDLNDKESLIDAYKEWATDAYNLDEEGHGDGWY